MKINSVNNNDNLFAITSFVLFWRLQTGSEFYCSHIKESVTVDITVHAHSTGRQNRVRIVFLHFNINIVIVSGKIHFLSGETIMQSK